MTSRETQAKVRRIVTTLEQARWMCEVISHLPSARELRERETSLIISHHNGLLLRQEQIEAVEGRAYNLHPSVLPLNRGASPVMWATLSQTIYGVTIHRVNHELDKGSPVLQRIVEIDEDLTLEQIYDLHEVVWYDMFSHLTRVDAWTESPASLSVAPLVSGRGTYNSRQSSQVAFSSFKAGWQTIAREAREQYHSRFGM